MDNHTLQDEGINNTLLAEENNLTFTADLLGQELPPLMNDDVIPVDLGEEVNVIVTDEALESISTPAAFDLTYQANRQLVMIQCACVFFLIVLKYFSHCTRFKLKGFQVKLYGSLILTQSLMMHKRMDYS